MTILLTLTLWSFTATLPPPDAGEGDRAPVADRDRGTGTPLLVARVEDEACHAVRKTSGGTPGAGPLAGSARRGGTSSRRSASLAGLTPRRPRLRIRLRC